MLNINEKDQVNVLLYGYQIDKPKSFSQSILKNVISYVKATGRFDKPLISFRQCVLLKPIKHLRWSVFACNLGCLIGSWYATKLGMYLPPHTKLNFQNLFYYD